MEEAEPKSSARPGNNSADAASSGAPHQAAANRIATLILAIALALRLYIAAQGGALYWTDEKRYNASREALGALVERDGPSAAHYLLSTSDHIGFRWLALVPAAIERIVYGVQPPHAKTCAFFFAFFSAANLYLVWRIARRVATRPWEAELALLFAACSNALFFFARHCFPYDASLTFFLAAIYVGLAPRSRWQPLAVGALCGVGYLVYNGYWSVGAAVLVHYVTWRRDAPLARGREAMFAGAGLLTPILSTFGLARLCGYDLVGHSLWFADTVNQGDFGEAWRFVPEYLRVTDGWLGVALLILIGGGGALAWRRREVPAWLRWLCVGVLLVGTWIACCDVVEKFVPYGRTVRALVPFLALAAGGAVTYLWEHSPAVGRVLLATLAVVGCAGGAAKMIPPLRQVFPAEFRAMAQTVMAAARARDPGAEFAVLYADYLYGPDFPPAPPAHRELLRRAHPHHYAPYLYEGYTRAQRPLYLGPDTAMRVIELDRSHGGQRLQRSPSAGALGDYPGPLFLRLLLPAKSIGKTETLLVHGRAAGGVGQRVLMSYPDGAHVRFGLEVANSAPVWSRAIACDFSSEHGVMISLGSFYPAVGPGGAANSAELAPLVGRFLLRCDGETLLSGAATFAAATWADLFLGAAVPASADAAAFSGEIIGVRQWDPRNAVDAEWLPVRATPPSLGDYRGPVELELRFPRGLGGRAQPIISSGVTGAADLLYVNYIDDEHVRFGLDHWGTGPAVSPVVRVEPGKSCRLLVSMGSLLPPRTKENYLANTALEGLRDRLLLRFEGELVLSRPWPFYPAPPDTVTLGTCATRATAAETAFSGEILHVRPASLDELGLTVGLPPPVRGPFFGDHHGAIEMRLQFPRGIEGGSETLLVSGVRGASDRLFVVYQDETHVRLGLEHWGEAPLLSGVITVTPGETHRLVASLGSLFPPQSDPRYLRSPQARILRDWLFVQLDDRVVFSRRFEFYAAAPDAVSVGHNQADAGSAFTGQWFDVRRRAPEDLGLEERLLAWPRGGATAFPATGNRVLTLTIRLPDFWDPGVEPLVVSGGDPERDMVLVRYRGARSMQIGCRHGTQPPRYSAPIPTAPGRTHQFGISLGSAISLSVDGRPALGADILSFQAAPDALHLGVDYFGTKGVRTRFSGKLLQLKTGAP